jgi:hypothetical protein
MKTCRQVDFMITMRQKMAASQYIRTSGVTLIRAVNTSEQLIVHIFMKGSQDNKGAIMIIECNAESPTSTYSTNMRFPYLG